MELMAGFLLGFLGSFHCIGMCGPLVLALPYSSKFILNRIVHNTGRVITYGLFGLFFGLISSRLYIAGLQQIVSLALGVLIILTVFIPQNFKNRILDVTGFNSYITIIKRSISKFYRSNSFGAVLGIGILNGFLPCGFVYMALTGALIIGNAFGSSAFMIMFGLGTIPAMLAVSAAGKIISINFRDRLKRFIPAFSLIIAVLFILRGLNLGIPYISPKLEKHNPAAENIICH